MHRPTFIVGEEVITVLAAGLWFLDRMLRLGRWLKSRTKTYCTITPLPEQATRVTMDGSIDAQSGSFAYLRIPGIRLLERHPFTLTSTQPAQFVVKAHDGFTKDLYNAACKNPRAKLRAVVEGPYGQVPDARAFDKVILVAGGSGATFAFAMALDWTKQWRASGDNTTLSFTWVVKNTGKP